MRDLQSGEHRRELTRHAREVWTVTEIRVKQPALVEVRAADVVGGRFPGDSEEVVVRQPVEPPPVLRTISTWPGCAEGARS